MLFALAEHNPRVLEEPKPMVWVLGLGASGVDLQFSCRVDADDFYQTQSDLYEEVKRIFDAEGIEIPIPRLSLNTGAATAPFPVRIADPAATP